MRKLRALFLKSFFRSHALTSASRCAWLLLAIFASVSALQAQTGTPVPMTLQEVVSLARSKNPNLLAAQQNLLSVKAQEIQAGLRANPVLTGLGTDVTNSASNPASPYNYSVQVSRLFERGEKRRWRLDSARSTTDQTRDQYALQEQQTILSVKQAFTNMLLAKAALKLAQDNLKDFRHELDINKARYDAGDIGKLDYERLDLQLAQFESDETNAEVSLKQGSYQLQTLIGMDRVSDNFDILGDILPPALATTMSDLEQRALAARPDYKAAQDAIRVADANVKLAYANGTTDPTLEGEYDRVGTFNSAGFNISIPLRIFDRNQGNKETSKYVAQASRFGEIAAKAQVYSDVDQAWAGYTASKVLADRYNGHYLDEAKDVLSIAQFAYEHGGLALLDYLNALQENRSTTLNALNADAQTWLAIHQLSFVTATDVAP
ncbi:cobalt-zinc-cadmium efflux system outer membrane protein [Silvibacterium bohemicum]|uniref:Cobalt-zinc-cadmium efflux system outer membrane protein n=1 Tax=Silvibacterium bohemicum TaxID=1577686 RepID=A0A841K5P9_9BACT|nr:TolC family protein [Silvibacterium bohemicum]MBB6147269.1 cobalt-zinc-cadmium efflux system outer membrane protein [Silvibacterium bohemicum]